MPSDVLLDLFRSLDCEDLLAGALFNNRMSLEPPSGVLCLIIELVVFLCFYGLMIYHLQNNPLVGNNPPVMSQTSLCCNPSLTSHLTFHHPTPPFPGHLCHHCVFTPMILTTLLMLPSEILQCQLVLLSVVHYTVCVKVQSFTGYPELDQMVLL